MPIRFTVVAALAAAFTSGAHAQWQVTNLSPGPSHRHSTGYAGGPGTQGGAVYVGAWPAGNYHASVWSSTADSWVDLHPTTPNAINARSMVHAVSGNHQAGFVEGIGGGPSHASLWSGTAASFTDLHPDGYSSSIIRGMDATSQVGSAASGGAPQAGLWHGSSSSFVNLHPAGLYYSNAYGVSGNRQVGSAGNFGAGFGHAVMWSGSAASMIDLHPAGRSQSAAFAISGNQQVGQVDNTAALWSGTAASYVSLEPSGADGSLLNATDGTRQVGWARINNRLHAGLWTGTAASFFDLHTLLPASFTTSEARAVWTDATGVHVLGHAQDLSDSSHAILWTFVVPAPGATALFSIAALALASRRRLPS